MAWSRSKPRRQSCSFNISSCNSREDGSCIVIMRIDTYTFDSIALFFGDSDRLRTRGKRGVVIAILAKETEELVGILSNQLGKMRVASPKLLQNWLQHMRLLLNDLTQLLKLSIVAKKVEVAKTLAASGSSSHGSSSSRSGSPTTASATTGATTALLRGEVEQVDIAIVITSGGGGRSRGGLRGGGGSRSLLRLCRTQIFGDTLFTVSVIH